MLEKFTNDLKDELNGLSPEGFEDKKKKAFSKTLEKYPPLSLAYNQYIKGGRIKKNEDRSETEKLGHLVMIRYGAVVRSIRKKDPLLKTEKRSTSKKSVQSLLTHWVDNNDYVPSFKALEYFSGINYSTFTTALHNLKVKGYEFQNNGNGYIVTERPDKQIVLTTSQLNKIIEDAIKAVLK